MARKCMELGPEVLPVLEGLSKKDAGELFASLAERILADREVTVSERLQPVFERLLRLAEKPAKSRSGGRKGCRSAEAPDAGTDEAQPHPRR